VHGAWRRFAAHAFGGYRWKTKEKKEIDQQEMWKIEGKRRGLCCVKAFFFAK